MGMSSNRLLNAALNLDWRSFFLSEQQRMQKLVAAYDAEKK